MAGTATLSVEEQVLVAELRGMIQAGYGELTVVVKDGELIIYRMVSKVFSKVLHPVPRSG